MNGFRSNLNPTLVRARAPLRLGLAGGGTDVAPYCDIHGGRVLNATIDRYAYATIRLLDEPHVRFVATDREEDILMSITDVFDNTSNLPLHQAVYKEIINTYNDGDPIPLEISTHCDAPIGSGLGASSTLVVAMIKAFVELLNLPLDDYMIGNKAYKVERVDCNLQGGRQDQFSAAFGGFNYMEFYADGHTVVNPLRIKNWIICELEASLVLFYSGISRESATIIADQSSRVEVGESEALQAMHEIKEEALVMRECVLRGDFSGLVGALARGWKSKKESSKSISNPLIDEIYDSAMHAGALAGKVSGAGGGGFIMFFVPPVHRMQVIETLRNFDGEVSNCHFTEYGAQGWRL